MSKRRQRPARRESGLHRPHPAAGTPTTRPVRVHALRSVGMLAAALVLVLGAVRVHGQLSRRRAEHRLAEILGAEALSPPPPLGGQDTAAPVVLAALAALAGHEERLVVLAPLAMAPAAPLSPEQRRQARQAVEASAAAVATLSTMRGRPAARLGRWQRIEPEEEGKLQAGLLMLAQLAAVDGRLACEERDPGRFARSLAVLGGLATGLEMEDKRQPLLVGLLVEHYQHLLLARGLGVGLADGAPPGALEATLGTVDLRLAHRRALGAQVAQLAALRSPLSWSLRGMRAWLADAVHFDRRLARAIDELARQAGDVDRPLLASLAATESMPGLASIAAVGVPELPVRVQVVRAARGMARAALALRRLAVGGGGYPRELAQAPEALAAVAAIGVGVRLEHGADGSARLRVPGGDEALRHLLGDAGHPPLLSWELPPVGRPAP